MKSGSTGSSTYRPDIDGLRAIAVLGVILYHAKIGFFGGYVGVDVFYVISGYLITKIISESLEDNTFRFFDFWKRRIRRILPVAIVVSFSTLGVGTFLLLPFDLHELGEATFANSVMLSNVYHWQQLRGYFSAESELRPLLHTWSLSLEEQFYLIYPVMLFMLSKRKINFSVTLIVIAVASLVSSEIVVRWSAPTAFFFLPFRAWELVVGALVFTCGRHIGSSAWTANAISIWGFIFVIGSMLFYDSETLFPGMSAALPVFGAAMIIWANRDHRTVVGQLLSLRPIVIVGLLSYSLYLWHWPVLVFARYIFGADLPTPITAASLCLIALLSGLSWLCVEQPFRRGKSKTSPAGIIVLGVGTTLSVGIIGLILVWKDGVPARFAKSDLLVLEDASFRSSKYFRGNSTDVQKDLPRIGLTTPEKHDSVILVGDSHAPPLVGVLDDLLRSSNRAGLVAAKSKYPPIIEVENARHAASIWNKTLLNFIKHQGIEKVVVFSRWSTWLNNDQIFHELRDRLNELAQSGSQIWLLKPSPTLPFNASRAIYATRFGAKLPSGGTLDEYLQTHRLALGYLDRLRTNRIKVLDVSDRFFGESDNVVFGDGSRSYFRDDDHLSTYGAKILLAPILKGILER